MITLSVGEIVAILTLGFMIYAYLFPRTQK